MIGKAIIGVSACLALAGAAQAQLLYSTSFEEPTYTAGTSVVGVDGWAAGSGVGASQAVSTAQAASGTQSLEWDNTTLDSFYSVRREMPSYDPAGLPLITSVQLYLTSGTGVNRMYGLYYVGSPTGTLGGTVLGLNISGDGTVRAGTSWAQTYSGTGIGQADPGTFFDRWLTITLTYDPATGDGSAEISGLGGAVSTIGSSWSSVTAPQGLNLGTDWFDTADRAGVAYMDNLRIVQIPSPAGLAVLALGGVGLVARRRRA